MSEQLEKHLAHLLTAICQKSPSPWGRLLKKGHPNSTSLGNHTAPGQPPGPQEPTHLEQVTVLHGSTNVTCLIGCAPSPCWASRDKPQQDRQPARRQSAHTQRAQLPWAQLRFQFRHQQGLFPGPVPTLITFLTAATPEQRR